MPHGSATLIRAWYRILPQQVRTRSPLWSAGHHRRPWRPGDV